MNHTADYSYIELANRMPDLVQASGKHCLMMEYEYKPVVYDFGSTFNENGTNHTDACGWIAVSGAVEMMVELDKSFGKRKDFLHQKRDTCLKSMYDRGCTTPDMLKTLSGNRTTNCRITNDEFERMAISLGVQIVVLELQNTHNGPILGTEKKFGFSRFTSQIHIFLNGYNHYVVMFDAVNSDDVGRYRKFLVNYDDIPDFLTDDLSPDAGRLAEWTTESIHASVTDDHGDYDVYESDDYDDDLAAFENECEKRKQAEIDAKLALVLQTREDAEAAKTAKQFEEDASYAVTLARLEHLARESKLELSKCTDKLEQRVAELNQSAVKLERVATVARSKLNPNAKPWGK